MEPGKKYPRIKVVPPGPRAREIIGIDEKLLLQSFTRWYPLVIERASGFLVEDVDGNVYIDMNSGLAVCNVGHRHPKVLAAIKRQLDRFLHYSITDFYYAEVLELARKIFEITPGSFEKRAFFCNSGAEAVEAAIKIARGHFEGRRPYILAFTGSFHGRTMGALSLTSSKPIQRKGFAPLLPCVEHVPYPYCYRCPFRQTFPDCDYWCIDFIKEWIFEKYLPPSEVCAIVFEPIAGEGGYIVPPPDFFPKLERLAREYEILLIDDEVQAGMGRTGKWFAIEHWDVVPDIIAIAKGVASGLPLGITVGRGGVMDLSRGSHASTFGGNPVSCAAACAVIDAMREEGLLENAAKVGERALKRLRELEQEVDLIGDVRGVGLMIGVELVKDRRTKEPAVRELERVLLEAFKRGVLFVGAGLSTVRIAPPLCITEEAMDVALDILGDVLRECSRGD